jgi:hypothetical protein
MGTLKHRGLVVLNSVMNEMISAENGAVVFSSTTGRQYALENVNWGNGAFTKGMVEGIRGKADYRATGRISANMLDLYVSERVKELTGASRPRPPSSRPTCRTSPWPWCNDDAGRIPGNHRSLMRRSFR